MRGHFQTQCQLVVIVFTKLQLTEKISKEAKENKGLQRTMKTNRFYRIDLSHPIQGQFQAFQEESIRIHPGMAAWLPKTNISGKKKLYPKRSNRLWIQHPSLQWIFDHSHAASQVAAPAQNMSDFVLHCLFSKDLKSFFIGPNFPKAVSRGPSEGTKGHWFQTKNNLSQVIVVFLFIWIETYPKTCLPACKYKHI